MTAAPVLPNEPPSTSLPGSLQFGRFTTKLSSPRLRPNVVTRQQLLQRISHADAPVTILCAPAGYGKSTLATQWLVHSGVPAAWVSLDSYDNDPLDFFSLIVGAIQSIDRDVGAATSQLLHEVRSPTSQAIAKSLLEDVYATTRPFALVLDDYQEIDNVDIHEAMSALLLRLPGTMRVVIVSRTEPAMQLARLRSRQELLELGHEELRFSDDEALELLQRFNGLELTPGDVFSINDRAEGWVAGLQLVSYVLRGHSPERVRQFTNEFSGSVRSIENYLWEETIQRQSEATKQFLLRTSILSRFNAPLCEVVTGRADSATVLRQLEHDQMFLISLDEVGQWYRYHHLFADVLRDRLALETSEEDLARIHRGASAWYEENDQTEDAARHAFAGRDWERAVRLLERIGTELYYQDRITALHSWLQGLPQETLERSPRLALYLSYALIRLGFVRQAEDPMKIADDALTLEDNPVELSLVRLIKAQLSLATDIPHAISLAQEAIELLPEGMPHERSLGYLVIGLAFMLKGECAESERAFATTRSLAEISNHDWVQLAEFGGSSALLMQQGKLEESAVLARRILKLGDEMHAIPIQQAHVRLGEIYLEWNLLSDAERHFLHAEHLCDATNSILWRYEIGVGLARLAWARGDFEIAFDEIERGISFANEANRLTHIRFARAFQARFWVDAGRLALARLWAEGSDLDPTDSLDYVRFDEFMTLARLLVKEEQLEVARSLLETMAESARANGRNGDLVEISVLLAVTHKAEGNHAEALDVIDRALTLGVQGGYVRVFIDEGETIAPLLRHSSTRGANRDYVQSLLAAIDGSPVHPTQASADMFEALSEREIEVLRLVSAGLPNRNIGERLFITEKTVKKHLSNILGKLGATNRTQAVDQARRFGLI
jgi:LuxR family maltose regulon positive regulatory protein